MKITVVGSGGWGTALALLLLENGNDVTLWSHRESTCETLCTTHENPLLKGVALPDALKHTSDLAAVKGCQMVVMVTPSRSGTDTLACFTAPLVFRKSRLRSAMVSPRQVITIRGLSVTTATG